jgi:hypothetical protein
MKHEIKSNCEYLLNMPVQQRRKALFQSQLTRFRKIKKTTIPRYSHTEIENCRFTALQNEEREFMEAGRSSGKEEKRVVELVKRGFINELYL